MPEKGRVRVYTGDGKGKTTASLGKAFQALGRERKVYMVQFMKAPDTYGEHMSAKTLQPNLVLKSAGRKGFYIKRICHPLDTMMAQQALVEANEAMSTKEFQLIILDEINVAIHIGLIDLDPLLDFIEAKPVEVELIITGRNVHPDVAARADEVSEFKALKHYFNNGVQARKGLEY